MKIRYMPKGVCSKIIDIEVEDNIIKSVKFYGGCAGNAEGLSRVLVGMEAHKAIELLKGTQCGNKGTSCPDQLAIALEEKLN